MDMIKTQSIGSILFAMALFAVVFVSCNRQGRQDDDNTLHIIHAGSLSVPVRELSKAFKAEHPEVTILTEAWGSKAGARRVADS